MKCRRCCYEGEPEYGEFREERMLIIYHHRCPKCKSSLHTIIFSWERLQMAIDYGAYCYGSPDYGPHKKIRNIVHIGEKGDYFVICPVCQWGCGGGFIPEPHRARLLAQMSRVTSGGSVR